MFCAGCGRDIAAGTTTCGSCGTPVSAAAPTSHSQLGEKVKARSQDALKALKLIAVNPVGALAEAFRSLEKRQALEVGIVFAAAFEICAVIGMYLILPRWAGSPGIGDVIKFLILGVVPFAAIVGACALARQVFHGSSGSIEGDVFMAGIALLPFGAVFLLAGLLGAANLEVTGIAGVFALSYTILILYTGCTRISGISEARAAPAVPIIILIAGWLSKILFSAML
jgi:hypothetical protein